MGNRETKSVSVMPTSKKTFCLATVAACASLLVVPAIPAKAQVVIDLSVVTCGQYMDKDRDTKDVLAAWMSGYFNAAKNQSMVDLARFERNRKAVETYCKKHKLETLMSAIQRNAY
jgi:acid stress chaperone HdeB